MDLSSPLPASSQLLSHVLLCFSALFVFALVEGSVYMDGMTAANAQLQLRNAALQSENARLRSALQQASARPSTSPMQKADATSRAKYLLAITSSGRQYATLRTTLRAHFNEPAWDCVLYSLVPYASTDAARAIRERCRVLECVGCAVANAWNLTTPAVTRAYEYVMLLSDEVELPRAAVSPSALLDEAQKHRLDVASPAVLGAKYPFAMAPDRCHPRKESDGGNPLRYSVEEGEEMVETPSVTAWREGEAMMAPPCVTERREAKVMVRAHSVTERTQGEVMVRAHWFQGEVVVVPLQ